MFLRNSSHVVGVDVTLDPACEHDDTEQISTKLADDGNGGAWVQSWPWEVRDLTFALTPPPASDTPGVVTEVGEALPEPSTLLLLL